MKSRPILSAPNHTVHTDVINELAGIYHGYIFRRGTIEAIFYMSYYCLEQMPTQ